MKRSNCLLIAIILLSLASCKKQSAPASENRIANYIALNKSQSFYINGDILTCSLDSVIQESRCPINAVCIWAGVAVARFNISLENTHTTITLATSKFGEYDKEKIIARFKMEFIDLAPHPEPDRPFNYDDYVAEVKITKL